MKDWEFYGKYANTPLPDRDKAIDAGLSGIFTLAEIYHQVHNMDDYIRLIEEQKKNLIAIAEKQWTDSKNTSK